LLVHYPQLRSHATELSADLFPHSEKREIFLAWRDSDNVNSMRQGLDTTIQEHLDALLTKSLPPLSEEEQEHALHECVYRLQERWLRDLKAKEEWLISDVQSDLSAAELEEIQQLAVRLNTQLREVFLQRKSKPKS